VFAVGAAGPLASGLPSTSIYFETCAPFLVIIEALMLFSIVRQTETTKRSLLWVGSSQVSSRISRFAVSCVGDCTGLQTCSRRNVSIPGDGSYAAGPCWSARWGYERRPYEEDAFWFVRTVACLAVSYSRVQGDSLLRRRQAASQEGAQAEAAA